VSELTYSTVENSTTRDEEEATPVLQTAIHLVAHPHHQMKYQSYAWQLVWDTESPAASPVHRCIFEQSEDFVLSSAPYFHSLQEIIFIQPLHIFIQL
jgi:hypothetical protein